MVVTSPWEGNISGQVDGNKCFVHPYDQSHLNCLSNMFSGLWQSCYTRSSSGSFVENCFLVILPRMQPSNETCPKTPKLCLRKLGSTSQSFTSYSPHITTSNALCTDVSENFTVHRARDDSLKLNLSGEDCDGPRRNRKAYNFQMGLLNTLEAMRLCKGDN